MTFRHYDHDRDREAAQRIWRETGWLPDDKTDAMDIALQSCCGHVAEIEGEAECLVLTSPGTIRYLAEDLPFGCVTAVTTSRIARKQGFAGKLTARAIAEDVANGAIVSALGMFEQGYYDRLGFGSGPYVHRIGFHPARLRVAGATRPPRRLTADDSQAAHDNRIGRLRSHGAVNITDPEFTRYTLVETGAKSFGLGYFDGPNGELSHHLWIYIRGDVEAGPYSVLWTAWNTREQFLELMGLLKNLGDQIHLIYMRESNGIQLQDLVDKPFQNRVMTENSPFDARMRVHAYWQIRICDLGACLERTHLRGGELRFNLSLSDPIETYLPDDSPWRGVAGEYIVTLGSSSGCDQGHDDQLPTMTATVNAFTRMWLGVRPATGLNLTDDLDAPRDLLEALDRTLRLPVPETDWDF